MTYEKLKERRALMEDNKLIIYKNSEGNIIVDAIYKNETLWLSQKGMAKVFDVGIPAISKHLKNIFEENELDKNSVVSKMEITAPDGKNYNTEVYSLDAIIAVGYRVNSKKATEFRIWATKILKEYMTKGFALNDERFINGNKYDTKYFNELLERIKTIRVSERMAYQKITDLFIATATDYNQKSEEAYTFFKIVQNKLHFAISGHTAAELIYSRANSDKEHMVQAPAIRPPGLRLYRAGRRYGGLHQPPLRGEHTRGPGYAPAYPGEGHDPAGQEPPRRAGTRALHAQRGRDLLLGRHPAGMRPQGPGGGA